MNKVLSIVVELLIVAVIGAIGYVTAIPKVLGRFTKFYILETEGKTIDYPMEQWEVFFNGHFQAGCPIRGFPKRKPPVEAVFSPILYLKSCF